MAPLLLRIYEAVAYKLLLFRFWFRSLCLVNGVYIRIMFYLDVSVHQA
jgi:hypothetical protein